MSKFTRILKSFVTGEFLLTLGLDKYIIHVIYTFFLFMLAIWTGIRVEKTFIRMEANKQEINALKIRNRELHFEMETLHSEIRIQQLLREAGSPLHKPEKPAHQTR